MRRAVHTAMKASAFDINAALAKFVTNPREFRGHQAACNALLHSEFARAFFDRTTDCTDLCISCGEEMDNGRVYRPMRAFETTYTKKATSTRSIMIESTSHG
jgi:hypothetical protein